MNHAASKVMETPESKSTFSRLNLKALTPYGFLLPFLIIFSVFGIFPLLFSIFFLFMSGTQSRVWALWTMWGSKTTTLH